MALESYVVPNRFPWLSSSSRLGRRPTAGEGVKGYRGRAPGGDFEKRAALGGRVESGVVKIAFPVHHADRGRSIGVSGKCVQGNQRAATGGNFEHSARPAGPSVGDARIISLSVQAHRSSGFARPPRR